MIGSPLGFQTRSLNIASALSNTAQPPMTTANATAGAGPVSPSGGSSTRPSAKNGSLQVCQFSIVARLTIGASVNQLTTTGTSASARTRHRYKPSASTVSASD